MKASRFSDAQKAFILKQAEEGVPIGDVCRKAGISQVTFYSWRKKYAGMTPPEMRRLKALEDENARLKKLVAELSLDREMLQDVVRRNGTELTSMAILACPGVRGAADGTG
jgi:putative transposase